MSAHSSAGFGCAAMTGLFALLLPLALAMPAPSSEAAGLKYRTDKSGTTFTGVGADNPVIYDNDVFDDVIDFDYLLCKASLGEVNLAGIVGTAVTPKGGYVENWWTGTEGPFPKYEAARESGLRMERIPKPVKGVTTLLERPNDGVIEHTKYARSEGSDLIEREAMKATPKKPLLIFLGGQSPTVAAAYLRNPRIADRVVVFYTDGNGYNSGDNKWAAYIVLKKLPTVNIGKSFWFKETSKKTQCDWNVLPTPGRGVDTGDACSKDEWALFPDQPLARDKGVLHTLRTNGHYNGAWNIGHWDGPLDGFWIGIYAPKWWQSGFKRFNVAWKDGTLAWTETTGDRYDVLDQLKMTHDGERAAHDELLKTWINPRVYSEGDRK
ncbi:MAG: hypothetical protein KY468_13280 [Armatimonadetes bacterium]|nr:hypothetical protein [Armatimonadota bacterium]